MYIFLCIQRSHRGHDRMVVEFTTTYAISAYHHWCCEFKSRSGQGAQHYVIKFVSDLQQVSGFLRFLHQWNWPPRYNWNIVESGVKHHQTYKQKQLSSLLKWVETSMVLICFIVVFFHIPAILQIQIILLQYITVHKHLHCATYVP
jgi:hypothetical protein